MAEPTMHSTHRPGEPVTCMGCPTVFTPKRSWQKFCTDPCRTEFHKKRALGPEGRLAELERIVAKLRIGQEELDRRVDQLEAAIAKVPA